MPSNADQERAFLAAIGESPFEDTPRLVFADWLDDHGQEKRAEYIRTKLSLSKIYEYHPSFASLNKRSDELTEFRGMEEEQCAVATLATYGAIWDRGVISGISCTLRNLNQKGALSLFETVPSLSHLELTLFPEDSAMNLKRLASHQQLRQVKSLWVRFDSANTAQSWHLHTLLDSPHWETLERLSIYNTRCGDAAIAALADVSLPCLKHLSLTGVGLTALGTAQIAAWSTLNNLAFLNLSGNPIGNEGATALAASPYLKELQEIGVRGCHLTDWGYGELIRGLPLLYTVYGLKEEAGHASSLILGRILEERLNKVKEAEKTKSQTIRR